MTDLYGDQPDADWAWQPNTWDPYTFGTRFQVTEAGLLTRAGYYRDAVGAPSWTSLHLYGPTGTLLWTAASPTDSGAVGWQWTAIDPPVAVAAGQTHTVAGFVDGSRSVARNTTPASRQAAPAPFVLDAAMRYYTGPGGRAGIPPPPRPPSTSRSASPGRRRRSPSPLTPKAPPPPCAPPRWRCTSTTGRSGSSTGAPTPPPAPSASTSG